MSLDLKKCHTLEELVTRFEHLGYTLAMSGDSPDENSILEFLKRAIEIHEKDKEHERIDAGITRGLKIVDTFIEGTKKILIEINEGFVVPGSMKFDLPEYPAGILVGCPYCDMGDEHEENCIAVLASRILGYQHVYSYTLIAEFYAKILNEITPCLVDRPLARDRYVKRNQIQFRLLKTYMDYCSSMLDIFNDKTIPR